jgi:hypothetical protein
MGMYTEIYVNVDLKATTPDEVITVLKAMCGKLDKEAERKALKNSPDRWCCLFSDGSFYTPRTHCKFLERDTISNQWSLLGKGDTKNYGAEIQKFFEWISPWVDGDEGDFIGYSRYEEDQQPQLYFLTKQ